MGVAPLIITANDMIVKFLLPVHMILCSDDGGVLFPKGGVLPLGEMKMFPLNWKLTATWTLWVPHAFESIGKGDIYCTGWMIDPDYQQGNLTNTPLWSKEEYV